MSRKRDARRRVVRIVHAADIHLDSTFAQARVGSRLGHRLRSAAREAFKRVLALVESEQAHALLIAGDLYDHEYVTPDTGAFLVEAFAALGNRPVVIAPGNHDPCLPDSLYARLDWPPNVHIFRSGVPETVCLEEAGLVVHGFGHRDFEHRGGLVEGVGAPAGDDGGLVHVAAAHGADVSRVPPGKETCAPFQPADLLQVEGIRYWALGHYHAQGEVASSDGVAAYYSGCIQGRHFGETGPRHALVVTIDGTGVEVKPVEVSVCTFETAEVDVGPFSNREALVEHVRGLCEAPAWRRAVVRLVLAGEAQPSLELDPRQLREGLEECFEDLVIDDRTLPALDPEEVAGERTARGEFARRLLRRIEEADDHAERERLRLALRVGLAAYEGRSVPVE